MGRASSESALLMQWCGVSILVWAFGVAWKRSLDRGEKHLSSKLTFVEAKREWTAGLC